MKQLRLLALAAAATALCSVAAVACDTDKTSATAASAGNVKSASACAPGKKGASATTAAHAGCSAEMAARCTPEMAAACAHMKASGAVAAGTCPMTGESCTSHAKGARATAAMASSDCCASKSSKATAATASTGSCGSNARTTTAVMAAMAPGGCGSHGKTTAMAAGSSCGSHAKSTTMAAGSSCGAHAKSSAMAGHSCDACSDMAVNEEELTAAGARAQVVPLKNGVMYVYTAEAPERVRAVQAAVTRGNDRARALLAAGDKAKLCPGCKEMRGAMASGKLQREVVNVETGALTLVTSNDKGLVNRIHEVSGASMAARTSH